jgi:hypothetical protein
MGKQIKPFVPALFSALLVLGVTLPDGPASAADDCLAAPKSEAPEGSHWYYRSDRVKHRKCWYLRPDDRNVRGGAPQVGARDPETAGNANPVMQTSTPPGPAGDALTRRECDTELNVLQYKKIIAGLSDLISTGDDIDVRMVELAAKGCQKPSAGGPSESVCERAALKWSLTDRLGEEEIKSRLKSAGCTS